MGSEQLWSLQVFVCDNILTYSQVCYAKHVSFVYKTDVGLATNHKNIVNAIKLIPNAHHLPML